MGVVKKERLSQLYGIDPFHTGLFLKALVASVMTLAQLFLIDPFYFLLLELKENSELNEKNRNDIYAILIVRWVLLPISNPLSFYYVLLPKEDSGL